MGSNAIRLSVGKVDKDQKVAQVENFREAVRLGRDVFANRAVSEPMMEEATGAFRKFREIMDRSGVKWSKAVATSAIREATNRETFIDRMQQASGINIDVITSEEEARLIFLAVSGEVNLRKKTALLLDIGGGSIKITLTIDGSIISAESFRLGSVRLLQLLEEERNGEKKFNQLVREYVDAAQQRLKREIGGRKIDVCVATGGSMETLATIRKDLFNKERDSTVGSPELDSMVRKLASLSFEERVSQFRLRPDRADVIVPAAIIVQELVRIAKVEEIVVPRVGLKDGIILDLCEGLFGNPERTDREQVLTSALQIGRKYSFDEQHGMTVARLALQLFDMGKSLHNLPLENRLLLEVAAMLHDVGSFIGMTAHHKHTLYLLTANPVIGLNESKMAVVANVARYHRKSIPKMQHEQFRVLPPRDRILVSKLAAMLRLADALDTEHASRVESFSLDYRKPKLVIRLQGVGDLMLEKFALIRKADLFEEVFGVKVSVED